jgi:acyl-CoA synthetase (AMP-forming)/AMP-acid ligase II
MPSGIDAVAFFCAAIAAGVRWVPMDVSAAPAEVRARAERSRARLGVVLGAPDADAALVGVCPRLSCPDRNDQEHGAPLRVGIPTDGPDGVRLIRDRAGAIVLASSGTTALPKLALREAPALDADAAAVIAGAHLTDADCVLVTTPLSHSYAVDMLVAALCAGAALHVLARFEPLAIARQMQSSVTILPGVPLTFEALTRVTPATRARVRLAVSAGAPLPPRVRSAFTATWGIEVGNLYGATELGTVAMSAGTRSPDGVHDPGFVGPALEGARFRIVDPCDTRHQLGANEEGHLAVWAPSMLSGYLDDEAPMVDGYFLTGDLARLDAAGALSLTGRLKHLIDLGACKVNPLEIEAAILGHPGVAECAVVPVPASDTCCRLRALIVPRLGDSSATPESLRAFLRPRVAASKIPRSFELVTSLPKSPTGKLLREKC